MGEYNVKEWVCPVCETANTEETCVICGTKMNQAKQFAQIEDNKQNLIDQLAEISAETTPQKGSNWKRIVATIILLFVGLFLIGMLGQSCSIY